MPIRASLSIALSTDKHRVTGSRGQQDSSMGPTPTWHFDPRPCGDRGLPQLQIQKRAEVIQVLVHAPCGPYEGLIEHWRGGVPEKHFMEKVGHPYLGSEGPLYFISSKLCCCNHGQLLLASEA